ncbi:hypothetical protein C8R45DRAFT_1178687 [Mycena sanguinolenta]|nr:hypothetical protein C8R45DRAFT_1178687 [Mycena sanguinolenta]
MAQSQPCFTHLKCARGVLQTTGKIRTWKSTQVDSKQLQVAHTHKLESSRVESGFGVDLPSHDSTSRAAATLLLLFASASAISFSFSGWLACPPASFQIAQPKLARQAPRKDRNDHDGTDRNSCGQRKSAGYKGSLKAARSLATEPIRRGPWAKQPAIVIRETRIDRTIWPGLTGQNHQAKKYQSELSPQFLDKVAIDSKDFQKFSQAGGYVVDDSTDNNYSRLDVVHNAQSGRRIRRDNKNKVVISVVSSLKDGDKANSSSTFVGCVGYRDRADAPWRSWKTGNEANSLERGGTPRKRARKASPYLRSADGVGDHGASQTSASREHDGTLEDQTRGHLIFLPSLFGASYRARE